MVKKTVSCIDIEGKKHTIETAKLDWRISVYGLMIANGKILLLKQKLGYDFPGGGIEKGETIEQAFKREMWEETNLKVKMQDLIWAGSAYYYMRRSKRFVQNILLYYRCQRLSGSLSNKNFDDNEKLHAIGPEWVDIKNLNKIKFQNAINSVKLIKQALKK